MHVKFNNSVRNKALEEEKKYLDNERRKLNHKKDKLLVQIDMLTKSLKSTETENKKLRIEN